MRYQTETISWQPTEWMNRPDVDTTVLICTHQGDFVVGYWDDSDEQWIAESGEVVSQPVYWATVEGPMI